MISHERISMYKLWIPGPPFWGVGGSGNEAWGEGVRGLTALLELQDLHVLVTVSYHSTLRLAPMYM